MRRASAAIITVGLLLLVAPSAAALCITNSLNRAIAQSDSVWWGTVTAATPDLARSPGFQLTVNVHEVLKGPAVPGGIGTVYTERCGDFVVASQKAASTYVGKTELFLLTAAKDGKLLQWPELIVPQTMSEHDKLKEAQHLFGFHPPGGLIPPESHARSFAVVGAVLGLVSAGSALWILVRRRRRPLLPTA